MPRAISRPADLRLGFIALNDAAPLIVARENGFFRRLGLEVSLSREVGWATIRDKVVYGELDAAQALAAMLISTPLGLNGPAYPCLTACVMSSGGNSITLSERLWERGVHDAASLHAEIVRTRHERQLVFGVVYTHSTHYLHLCDWLAAGGINPRRDVRIVVVPPAQLYRNLAAGTIDGYCVGEPWTSLAVREKAGWCAVRSQDLAPNHTEKVLLVRNDFAENRSEEHLALVAAVTAAARLCDDPAFRPELVRLLARREYLNLPERIVGAGLTGPFEHGHDIRSEAAGLVSFSDNDPVPTRAEWLIDGFRNHGLLLPNVAIPRNFARAIFRTDLFQQACKRHDLPLHHDHALVSK